MAKVITFSRQFPKGHPRAGQPTYFVEQVLNSLLDLNIYTNFQSLIYLNQESIDDPKSKLTKDHIIEFWQSLEARINTNRKLHTIRSGNRWKAGDKASLRVWSGTPYNSPQIIFAPEVELKEVINFKTQEDQYIFWLNGKENPNEFLTEIAKNDGLNTFDLVNWFRFPSDFEGQILCWKEVHYG
jgi:hypothetical protein